MSHITLNPNSTSTRERFAAAAATITEMDLDDHHEVGEMISVVVAHRVASSDNLTRILDELAATQRHYAALEFDAAKARVNRDELRLVASRIVEGTAYYQDGQALLERLCWHHASIAPECC